MIDWNRVEDQMALEVLRQGEKKLQSTLEISMALDRRSAAFTGIFSTIAIGLIASVGFNPTFTAANPKLAVAVIVTAIANVLAAALCAYSSRPGKLHVPGSEPENWFPFLRYKFAKVIGGRCEMVQDHIVYNLAALKTNAQIMRSGLFFGIASPVLGLIARGLLDL